MAESTAVNREKLDYRPNVVGLIMDQSGEVLLIQKQIYKDDEWNFPGGGIEEGESESEALLRELQEELGNSQFQILQKSIHVYTYDWPDDVILRRLKEKGEKWRGQKQVSYLVQFTGDRNEIRFSKDEIRKAIWVKPKDLADLLVFPSQWEQARFLLDEFGISIE